MGEIVEFPNINRETPGQYHDSIESGAQAVAALEQAIYGQQSDDEIERLRFAAETALSQIDLEDYRVVYKRATQIQTELSQ